MVKIFEKENETGKESFSLYTAPEQGNKIAYFLVDGFILWLFLAGITGWFATACRLEISIPICVFGQGVIAAVLQFVMYGSKKTRWVKLVLYGIGIVLLFGIAQKWIFNGFHLLCNQVVNVIGEKFPYMFPYYEVTLSEEMQEKALLGTLWCLSLLVALLGEYVIAACNRFLLALLFLFIWILEITTGIGSGLIWNLILCFSFLGVWLKGHVDLVQNGMQRITVLESFLLTVAGAFLLILLTGAFLQKMGVQELSFFQKEKEALKQWVEDYRYEGESQVLPNGNFKDLTSFEPRKKAVLEITMSQPESYYLRGFIGEQYTGTGWEAADSVSLWENKDLFYWLHQSGFYGQEILGKAAVSLDETAAKEESNTVSIKNLAGNSKYCYVPYELLTEDTSQFRTYLEQQRIGDAAVTTEGFYGEREYSYKALSNQVTKYPVYATALLKEDEWNESGKKYKKLEEYYNEFVYDTYLEVPANIEANLSELLGERTIETGEKHVDYSEAKENILYVLTSENYTDETKLEEAWNGKDFIYEFLSFSKKGYSVHFASAAAMMFRYYGIPARYVEGYLVTPQDVEKMQAGEPYQIDETHAHAWVEYYQDGVGWLPFEITPSYLNTMNKAEDYQDISGAGSSDMDEEEEKQNPPEEEKEDEPEEETIDWLSIIIFILLICIVLMMLCILGFFIWVIYKRAQSRKMKKLFQHTNMSIAIKAMFEYSMNILSVAGIYISNDSLFSYGKEVGELFDAETAQEYCSVVEIRQEAVYSLNEMTEEQKQLVEAFKNKMWDRIYGKGNIIQKFQLKYIYFL